MHLCPVCLSKLHRHLNFASLLERYQRLVDFYNAHGLSQVACTFNSNLQ